MLRLLGFFTAVFALTWVLAQLPIVGVLFRIPFLGFWFTAILLSAVLAKLGTEALDHRARKSLERQLGAVDTPHHKGKLASLWLSQGKPKRAVPLFEEAVAGDPESLQWRYRLAQARFESGAAPGEVIGPLEHVLDEDEEFAFGAPMLLSARAHLADGKGDEALERVARFDRNHGPAPESALLRGRILKALDRRDEANRAFDDVGKLAKTMPGHATSRGGTPRLRAFVARWFG